MDEIMKGLGKPKKHEFVEYTKTRPDVELGMTTYRSRVCGNQFVVKVSVGETVFGLDLKPHEYCVLVLQANGKLLM